MKDMRLRLGIDLGGTKIEIVALDPRGGELLRRRIPTPQGDYRATIVAVANLVRDAERELGGQGTVGIGTPGSMSRATGLLRGCNSVCLNGQPLQRDLAAELGREVRITNDANCFALSEASDGAGAGAAVVFGVDPRHRRRRRHRRATAACSTGRTPSPANGATTRCRGRATTSGPVRACFCGKSGCIETFVSGPGLERDFLRATARAGEVARHRRARGERRRGVRAALARYEERLARALAHVINILDPDVIVLGGGMSNVERLYANVPQLWGRWVFSDRVDTRLAAQRARRFERRARRGVALGSWASAFRAAIGARQSDAWRRPTTAAAPFCASA